MLDYSKTTKISAKRQLFSADILVFQRKLDLFPSCTSPEIEPAEKEVKKDHKSDTNTMVTPQTFSYLQLYMIEANKT